MRHPAFRLLPLIAIAALSTPALALDMPPRKPGLWEIKATA